MVTHALVPESVHADREHPAKIVDPLYGTFEVLHTEEGLVIRRVGLPPHVVVRGEDKSEVWLSEGAVIKEIVLR